MKKIIQILLILILASILLLIAIFVFNPLNLRNKMIGGAINAYLDSAIVAEDIKIEKTEASSSAVGTEVVETEKIQAETALDPNDKNPLLNETQEKKLEEFGVDVEKLPKAITPEMEKCFMEKLGQDRGMELVNGAAPSAFEVIKIRTCIGL